MNALRLPDALGPGRYLDCSREPDGSVWIRPAEGGSGPINDDMTKLTPERAAELAAWLTTDLPAAHQEITAGRLRLQSGGNA